MEKQEKVAYWLDIADYDLDTAKSMLASGRYLYVVFMCQQALEKLIKAVYIHQFDAEPPRSHNLAFLFNHLSLSVRPETINLLNALSAHYLNNRYPEYKSKLSTALNKQTAETYLVNTEGIYTWLKSHLP